MKFSEYIRQMDEEELVQFFADFSSLRALSCTVCPLINDNSCSADSEDCASAIRNLLDRDVENAVFDDFFCR